MLGINDSKVGWWDEKDYKQTYKRMIKELGTSKTKVLAVVPTPLYTDGIYTM